MVKVIINNSDGVRDDLAGRSVDIGGPQIDLGASDSVIGIVGSAEVSASGLVAGLSTAATAITATAGTFDMGAVQVPANAVILDAGVVCTALLDGTSNSPNIRFGVGTSALGSQLLGSAKNVVDAGSMALGHMVSVATANSMSAQVGNKDIPHFKESAVLHSTSARAIHFHLITSADLDSAGAVRGFVNYMVI